MNPALVVLLRSLWVVPVFIGPLSAFLGFIAASMQLGSGSSRSWRHTVLGVVYLVGALVAREVFGAVPDVAAVLLNTLCWVAGIVHALIIFPRTLGLTPAPAVSTRARGARRREPARPRTERASRQERQLPEEARGLADVATHTRTQLLADEPRAERTAEAPSDARPAVDVNKASRAELRRLLGVDRARASQIVAERNRRGGFASIEDFARVAGLQPHELVRFRREAFCSARPRAPRRFGRRVDL